MVQILALSCSLFTALLASWAMPELLEGIRAASWPVAEGQLLAVYKGVWIQGGPTGSLGNSKRGGAISYSGEHYGVSLHYYYRAPGPSGAEQSYSGWRYDAATSGKSFLMLPGGSRGERWKGVHAGLPYTYAGIAREVIGSSSALSVRYDPLDPSRSVLNAGVATDTALILLYTILMAVASIELWIKQGNPGRGLSRNIGNYTLLQRTLAVGSFGLLYVPASVLSAVYLSAVIPSWLILLYAVAGLIWMFHPQLPPARK